MTKIQVDYENLLEAKRHNQISESQKQDELRLKGMETGGKFAESFANAINKSTGSLANLAKAGKDLIGSVGSLASFFA